MAGELTRTQMVSEVLDNLTKGSTGQTRSGVTLSDMAIRWLDRAQRKIARKENLLFCISTASTVANQKDYSFPNNIRSLYSIRVEDGLESKKLRLVMPTTFDKLIPKPDVDTTDRPSWYIPYKTTNTFELYRIPDTVYTLRMRYSFWPASLTTDSQVSDYTYLDDIIIGYATMYGWRWLQEYADARAWKNLTDEDFSEAVKAEREAFPDWVPSSQGFKTGEEVLTTEYYNNPFIMSDL